MPFFVARHERESVAPAAFYRERLRHFRQGRVQVSVCMRNSSAIIARLSLTSPSELEPRNEGGEPAESKRANIHELHGTIVRRSSTNVRTDARRRHRQPIRFRLPPSVQTLAVR